MLPSQNRGILADRKGSFGGRVNHLIPVQILKIYDMGAKPPDIDGNNPNTPSGEPEIGSGNISTSFEKK